eukprot:CAMPEP_0204564826 /NCGR_PEP_ID=MMETSP0661-20131031/35120_1 /ASSEMBLY_ACC=CAM_ASM_000606 /TAXON_ID=109239 /ORGANISM="Alexandrium margalefi, Strain AMGDE01CS-322" /LENGTH=62 /DNA_ID=CAMNT_0051572517 /DNA_START=98 /DNA_END=282 /DNA_ORIENTATION=+
MTTSRHSSTLTGREVLKFQCMTGVALSAAGSCTGSLQPAYTPRSMMLQPLRMAVACACVSVG